MSWTSILTALVLSATTAILVIIYEWEPWQAFLLVSGIAAVFILVLMAIMLWLSPPPDRARIWSEMKKEMQKEYRAMLNGLRKK